MSLAMRLNFDIALLDKLSEGVLVLDRQAQVVSHNLAAAPWASRVRAMGGVLKDLIELEVRGRIKLPVRLGVWTLAADASALSGEAWLIMNGRRDYAIFIAPCEGSTGVTAELTHTPVTETSYLSLLGDEARAQLAVLRQLLNPQAGTSLRDSAAITAQSQRVEHLLQELSDLSLLMQRDEVFADERLDLISIVRDAFPPTAAGVDSENPAFELRHHGARPGAVYGHAPWMSYALRVLLDALQTSSPAQSHITVTTRQMGDFVVLMGRVVANVSVRATQPQALSDQAKASNPVGAVKPLDASVRWLMCRRIIALHSGQLKLVPLPLSAGDDPANPPIESFTLTLATGSPAAERSRASCAACPHVLQEQAYAVDLAQLLTQR